MNILPVFCYALLGLSLFMTQCYFKYGFRIAFNFFLFAFLAATIKEGPVPVDRVLMKNPSMPYEFLPQHSSLLVNSALTIVGWVFTFYLGWYLADRIALRLKYWKNRIFPVLLLGLLVTASIGYSVEAAAIGMGWWHWTINDPRLSVFLIGVPFIVFETWMHFPAQYLLMPFFLIECSGLRRFGWVNIFFLIPFIHSVTTHAQPQSVRNSVEYAGLLALFLLAFVSPLRFDYSGVSLPKAQGRIKPRLIELLPMLVAITLIFILSFIDLITIQNPRLLISLLPICFLVLLSIPRIPLIFVILLNITCLLIFKKLAIFAALPLVIVLSLRSLTKIQISKGAKNR